MSGEDTPRVRSLRPGDPRELGEYRIVGRLGEGGMGVSTWPGPATTGRVALKVIRAELAGDPEFRGRFRSEVDRGPAGAAFCTAEVLDADTDHDPPYLVVEYVDGPEPGPGRARAGAAERRPTSTASRSGWRSR